MRRPRRGRASLLSTGNIRYRCSTMAPSRRIRRLQRPVGRYERSVDSVSRVWVNIEAVDWARRQRVKSPQKVVLYALASRCNAHGECWPSQPQLCDDTGLSTRTLRRALHTLRDCGLVKIVPRGRHKDKGGRSSDLYIISMVPAESVIPPSPLPRGGGDVRLPVILTAKALPAKSDRVIGQSDRGNTCTEYKIYSGVECGSLSKPWRSGSVALPTDSAWLEAR